MHLFRGLSLRSGHLFRNEGNNIVCILEDCICSRSVSIVPNYISQWVTSNNFYWETRGEKKRVLDGQNLREREREERLVG